MDGSNFRRYIGQSLSGILPKTWNNKQAKIIAHKYRWMEGMAREIINLRFWHRWLCTPMHIFHQFLSLSSQFHLQTIKGKIKEIKEGKIGNNKKVISTNHDWLAPPIPSLYKLAPISKKYVFPLVSFLCCSISQSTSNLPNQINIPFKRFTALACC